MWKYVISAVLLHPMLLLLFFNKWTVVKYITQTLFPIVNIILCSMIVVLVLSQRGEEGAFTKIISSQQIKTESSIMMKNTVFLSAIFVLLFIPINYLIYLQKHMMN